MRISYWSSDVCSSDLPGADLAHARTLAVADRHQPQIGERLHRLADRGPLDAETRHQLALGRQAFARAAFAADDHRLPPVEDFVGQRASDDGFVLGWCHRPVLLPKSAPDQEWSLDRKSDV